MNCKAHCNHVLQSQFKGLQLCGMQFIHLNIVTLWFQKHFRRQHFRLTTFLLTSTVFWTSIFLFDVILFWSQKMYWRQILFWRQNKNNWRQTTNWRNETIDVKRMFTLDERPPLFFCIMGTRWASKCPQIYPNIVLKGSQKPSPTHQHRLTIDVKGLLKPISGSC